VLFVIRDGSDISSSTKSVIDRRFDRPIDAGSSERSALNIDTHVHVPSRAGDRVPVI
jgi:hypothetical protein